MERRPHSRLEDGSGAAAPAEAPPERFGLVFVFGVLFGMALAGSAFLRMETVKPHASLPNLDKVILERGEMAALGPNGEFPSLSPTASITPSLSGTASTTPSLSGTSSVTPSSSNTPTPSQTPSPSISPTVDIAGCASSAAAWLNTTTGKNRASAVAAWPLPWDLLHGAYEQACGQPAAAATASRYRFTSDDVCYVVVSHDERGRQEAQHNAWGRLVRNYFAYAAAGDAGLRVTQLDALNGKAYNRRLLAVLAEAASRPEASGCKWWMLAGQTSWVNPLNVLDAVQGLPYDTAKVAMAFFWHGHGFTQQITCPSNGLVLYSKAAVDALMPQLRSGACPGPDALGLPTDDLALARCNWANEVVPVNMITFEESGALELNGVPLEPGPRPDIMAWLQQPHHWASHWIAIDGMSPDLLNRLGSAYEGLHGPWGRSSTVAGGAQPSAAATASPSAAPAPAGSPFATALPTPVPGSSACANAATVQLRSYLDRGRQGPSSAAPLSRELVRDVTAAACNGDVLGGNPDSTVPPPMMEHTCYFLSYTGDRNHVEKLLPLWPSRTPFTEADSAAGTRQLWLYGERDEAGISVFGVPGMAGVPSERRLMIALQHFASRADTKHCNWWFFGDDKDYVNPRSVTQLTRGMHHDTPLAMAFYWHQQGWTNGVTQPAKGKALYSRAAIAQMVPALMTPVCPSTPGDGLGDETTVARCALALGVLPVHTYYFDAANLGPGTDWAFQQPHYLIGWATMAAQSWDHSGLLELYFRQSYGVWGVVPDTWTGKSMLRGLAKGDGRQSALSAEADLLAAGLLLPALERSPAAELQLEVTARGLAARDVAAERAGG